jgi:hypothetical protein
MDGRLMGACKTYEVWTDAEKARALDMARAGVSTKDIAKTLGRSKSSVANVITRNGGWYALASGAPLVRPVAEYCAPSGPTLVEAFAPEASADEPDDAFLARMLGGATRSVEKAAAQRHARLRIASSQPVGLALFSDAHVSATGTDLAGLMEAVDFVAATPNLYALGMGDWLDNPIKHRGSNVGAVADDVRFLDLLMGRFRGKLLGTTSGNHDDWSKVFAGTDHLAALAKRHRIHYAPDELLWEVEIVDPTDPDTVTARYSIATRHQWRRGSALNPGHACWTWWQEEGPNWEQTPDVLAIGHNHVSVVESRQYEKRDMWAVRPGTFQKDSPFARAKGFGRYRATTPVVVLPPTRAERVICFSDPTMSIPYLTPGIARAA